jgi:hypothetical protein
MLSHFLFCWPRKWTTITRCKLNLTDGGKVVAAGERAILKCEKCGWLVKRDFI